MKDIRHHYFLVLIYLLCESSSGYKIVNLLSFFCCTLAFPYSTTDLTFYMLFCVYAISLFYWFCNYFCLTQVPEPGLKIS